MLDLIKLSLWGVGKCKADQAVFEEMKLQAIAALPAAVLSKVSMPDELRDEWRKYIMQQISHFFRIKHEQTNLPITVPYVILKGTSAAQYYPHPEYRAMGDIDLMTRREDYEDACSMLLEAGYVEAVPDQKNKRDRGFIKNGILVEMHAYFALLNNVEQAEYMDNLIVKHINDTHILPDLVNGLVILEHISQHLEEGLGLRQIIDWMMFVHKCLPDENWHEFHDMAQKIGLDKLALITTRMCELYLGLPERQWCKDADLELCSDLLYYILKSGNFGKKQKRDTIVTINVLYYIKRPLDALKRLQERGLIEWKAAKKYKILRPLAWIYQARRYLYKCFNRNKAVKKLRNDYIAAKRQETLFEVLGIIRGYKGNKETFK